MQSFLDTLNEKQKEAVTFGEGPLMIIAGAGSGKTRVLTTRIAFLIEKEISPFRIMALTFTNKAAKEMKKRIETLLEKGIESLWIGTFHSIFARILRIEAQEIGYDSNFTIYDTADSKSVLRDIIKRKNLDEKVYKSHKILSKISHAKNNLITPQKYAKDDNLIERDRFQQIPETAYIYQDYCKECLIANAMDFDDILVNTYLLLKNNLDVLYKYQNKFDYILIDEFQDTNLLQYELIRKMAAVKQNICVVGDDAQSIYSFRGANVENMWGFKKDYTDTHTIYLEENYRSTKNILDSANAIISNNSQQFEKNLWTSKTSGDKIQFINAPNNVSEGYLVVQSIIEEKLQKYLSYKDFCVLYRTNAQSRVIEEYLRKNNVPYKIYGGISFYDRQEVKNLLAYLKFICNPQDIEAFKRIVNFPKRGVGNVTINKILSQVIEEEKSLWEVLQNIKKYFTQKRMSKGLDFFVNTMKILMDKRDKYDAYQLAMEVAKEFELLKEYHQDTSVEGRNRYENLTELLNSIQFFVSNNLNSDTSAAAFLREISLFTSLDEEKAEEAVSLMTIHSAKGLEFGFVYVIGVEENIFPSYFSINDKESLEEERRLFYVALTRAEKKLVLSCCYERLQFGKSTNNAMSRFISEIPQDLFLQKNARDEKREKLKSKSKQNFTSYKKNYSHKSSENFTPSLVRDLQKGSRVEHSKFGFGTIKILQSDRVVVEFDKLGEKTLILSYAKLMLV